MIIIKEVKYPILHLYCPLNKLISEIRNYNEFLQSLLEVAKKGLLEGKVGYYLCREDVTQLDTNKTNIIRINACGIIEEQDLKYIPEYDKDINLILIEHLGLLNEYNSAGRV